MCLSTDVYGESEIIKCLPEVKRFNPIFPKTVLFCSALLLRCTNPRYIGFNVALLHGKQLYHFWKTTDASEILAFEDETQC